MGALADLQLSLFKRSVNHYYYMKESNTDAPACFKGNRVPGILFENKADYTTFFSVSICFRILPMDAYGDHSVIK
jgi:endo-1,3(4)-beta-glucanase